MIEVEVKLPISDVTRLREKLIEKGFLEEETVWESDTYFTHPNHDFWEKDEALRIRSSENKKTGKKSYTLTYKGAKMDAVSTTRTEYETGVEDAGVLLNILKAIGFCPVMPVEKRRTTFRKEGMTVCLDEINNLGTFMEVEILVPTSFKADVPSYEMALQRIEQFLHDMGYGMEDTTRRSYLGMLMEKSREESL